MNITETAFPGVFLIEPRLFRDDRGHFMETYRSNHYSDKADIPPFVQDNLSFSLRGVLRGLHYQLGRPQGKLIMVVQGEILDVAVDIRKGSPTMGKWLGISLSSENHRQIYIPPGFAHGFCVVSNTATVLYKCTDYYAPQEERGIRWDDPALGIQWPTTEPILSAKDRFYPPLDSLAPEQLPVFESNFMPQGMLGSMFDRQEHLVAEKRPT